MFTSSYTQSVDSIDPLPEIDLSNFSIQFEDENIPSRKKKRRCSDLEIASNYNVMINDSPSLDIDLPLPPPNVRRSSRLRRKSVELYRTSLHVEGEVHGDYSTSKTAAVISETEKDVVGGIHTDISPDSAWKKEAESVPLETRTTSTNEGSPSTETKLDSHTCVDLETAGGQVCQRPPFGIHRSDDNHQLVKHVDVDRLRRSKRARPTSKSRKQCKDRCEESANGNSCRKQQLAEGLSNHNAASCPESQPVLETGIEPQIPKCSLFMPDTSPCLNSPLITSICESKHAFQDGAVSEAISATNEEDSQLKLKRAGKRSKLLSDCFREFRKDDKNKRARADLTELDVIVENSGTTEGSMPLVPGSSGDDSNDHGCSPVANVDHAASSRGITRKRRVSSKSSCPVTEGSSVEESASSSLMGKATNKKRRNISKKNVSPEVNLEDLYCNKNFVVPKEKLWETIYESPSSGIGKKRLRRSLLFEEKVNFLAKKRKRRKRAVKNGWKPLTKPQLEKAEALLLEKLANFEAELEELEAVKIHVNSPSPVSDDGSVGTKGWSYSEGIPSSPCSVPISRSSSFISMEICEENNQNSVEALGSSPCHAPNAPNSNSTGALMETFEGNNGECVEMPGLSSCCAAKSNSSGVWMETSEVNNGECFEKSGSPKTKAVESYVVRSVTVSPEAAVKDEGTATAVVSLDHKVTQSPQCVSLSVVKTPSTAPMIPEQELKAWKSMKCSLKYDQKIAVRDLSMTNVDAVMSDESSSHRENIVCGHSDVPTDSTAACSSLAECKQTSADVSILHVSSEPVEASLNSHKKCFPRQGPIPNTDCEGQEKSGDEKAEHKELQEAVVQHTTTKPASFLLRPNEDDISYVYWQKINNFHNILSGSSVR